MVLFIHITRLASNKIFSPSNKIHREVGRAKDLSAPRHLTYYVHLVGIKEVAGCKMHGVESFKINVRQMFASLDYAIGFIQTFLFCS